MSLKIDRARLRADIKATSQQLRELKEVTRESGQPRLTWRVRADIAEAKSRATLLCSLAAHARGRLHRPAVLDAEAQGAYVAQALAGYALPEPPAEASETAAPEVAPPVPVPVQAEPTAKSSWWQQARTTVLDRLRL